MHDDLEQLRQHDGSLWLEMASDSSDAVAQWEVGTHLLVNYHLMLQF